LGKIWKGATYLLFVIPKDFASPDIHHKDEGGDAFVSFRTAAHNHAVIIAETEIHLHALAERTFDFLFGVFSY